MKKAHLMDFIVALSLWHRGEQPVENAVRILGDDHNELWNILILNGVMDYQNKPVEGFSFQEVFNLVVLYVSMRSPLRKQA